MWEDLKCVWSDPGLFYADSDDSSHVETDPSVYQRHKQYFAPALWSYNPLRGSG